ncbi:MAG TPA: enolase C-terminal domain-like protein, partial [Longimicrobiales bacterium]
MPAGSAPLVEQVDVAAYTVPTDAPEADGTIAWDATTMVLVRATSSGVTGLGYSYADPSAAELVRGKLAGVVRGADALSVGGAWLAMWRALRNIGRPGIAAHALSAVDNALWDLKARLLGIPLVQALDGVRLEVPIYGSGGFTSYSVERLRDQLGGWMEQGIGAVKMKIGTDPGQDLARVRAAREAIGPRAALFVDANGAYSRKQALAFAEAFSELDVTWFEEPVPSDDLVGLRLLRDRAPAAMDIAAGEYGYDVGYFRDMLQAQAVDVLQADATRCGGITGFLRAGALADAFQLDLSAHTAPALHVHACCALPRLRNLEYFHDHARIERMLFDGALQPQRGVLRPDLSRPGLGVEPRWSEFERFEVSF